MPGIECTTFTLRYISSRSPPLLRQGLAELLSSSWPRTCNPSAPFSLYCKTNEKLLKGFSRWWSWSDYGDHDCPLNRHWGQQGRSKRDSGEPGNAPILVRGDRHLAQGVVETRRWTEGVKNGLDSGQKESYGGAPGTLVSFTTEGTLKESQLGDRPRFDLAPTQNYFWPGSRA